MNTKKKVQEEIENSDSIQKIKKKLEEKKLERSKSIGLNFDKEEANKQFNLYANQRVDL